jgi:DNA-binding protein Fis
MKNILLPIIMLLVSPTLVAPTSNKQPEVIPVKTEVVKNMDLFLNDLGHQESGNRYDIVNRFGYMGRYQFGNSTLRTLKIKVTRDAFLNSPDLQEYAMQQNLLYNKKKLQKYIDKFEGKEINGILITESGILAAAHLGGAGSVRKYFRSGKVMEDGNGVKITRYMEQFSGYILWLT